MYAMNGTTCYRKQNQRTTHLHDQTYVGKSEPANEGKRKKMR